MSSQVELNEFEAAIPERIARMSRERLEAGREEYGAWEPGDDRDYLREIEEELLDALHYVQAARAAMRKKKMPTVAHLTFETGKLVSHIDASKINDINELIDQTIGNRRIDRGPFLDAVWRWHGGDVTRVRWTATTCEIDGMTARREDDAWTVPIDLWAMLTEGE